MNKPRFVVLAAIDESPDADRVVASASTFARSIAGGELHIVHVVPAAPTAGARAYVDRRAREASATAGVPVTGHLNEGQPARAIVQTAASIDADLVIVGSHDHRRPAGWRLGSVSEKVAARTACPVLVVRAKGHHAVHAPEIEPPCPQCVAAQGESRGRVLWCARHAEHHPRAHVHYEVPEPFAVGSNLIRPE
jgi:nucleotide-binding universal stress UspA family protein